MNRKVQLYKLTRNSVLFTEIYEAVQRNILNHRRKRDIMYALAGDHDIEAIYDDTLMRAVDNFRETDSGDFERYFTRCISNAIKDLRRKNKRVSDAEDTTDDIELVVYNKNKSKRSAYTDDAINLESFRRQEQRKLISHLLEGEDRFTLEVANRVKRMESLREIGKSLGTNPMKVSRCLARLAKKYDSQRFGKIEDYLYA